MEGNKLEREEERKGGEREENELGREEKKEGKMYLEFRK